MLAGQMESDSFIIRIINLAAKDNNEKLSIILPDTYKISSIYRRILRQAESNPFVRNEDYRLVIGSSIKHFSKLRSIDFIN